MLLRVFHFFLGCLAAFSVHLSWYSTSSFLEFGSYKSTTGKSYVPGISTTSGELVFILFLLATVTMFRYRKLSISLCIISLTIALVKTFSAFQNLKNEMEAISNKEYLFVVEATPETGLILFYSCASIFLFLSIVLKDKQRLVSKI